MRTAAIYEQYLRDNWPSKVTLREIAIMGLGGSGETGEWQEHLKKVIRDYNPNAHYAIDLSVYPAAKRAEALLEFGDALHYMLKCAGLFGFTLEEIMEANMDKLDTRWKRQGWRERYAGPE